MMRSGLSVLAVVSGLACATGLNAQSTDGFGGPAEAPPASFEGASFVDSKGCMFFRTEAAGKVVWVARVTRSGLQVCGFKPTEVARSVPQQKPAQTPSGSLVPQGFKPAWTDGRLNEQRGPRPSSSLSTVEGPKLEATAPIPTDGPTIQVASFSVPANAKAVQKKLRAAGWPTQIERQLINGRQWDVVMVGPFASAAEASGAQAEIHAMGFADAFLR